MSDDDLSIKPEAVRGTGQQLASISAQARAETDTFFDAQAAAAAANPGFRSGAKAVDYATKLHGEMNGFIDALERNAASVIRAAQGLQTMDDANAAGFNRELSALNGLTKPALPGS
ncbi:hypothetical protein [Mycolicibacterium komossense]|uniref:ESX-1 secretion-associated protein n=1 Tax=Mycolicibacterium komossense TaxID=1779 RepID=A0ABT3CLW8_9MYCO|nr:hypothetical protein [Mycolicibacterium komossense]MCV7230484.1 hypothetical protein [Mycolicibacterium komossense]